MGTYVCSQGDRVSLRYGRGGPSAGSLGARRAEGCAPNRREPRDSDALVARRHAGASSPAALRTVRSHFSRARIRGGVRISLVSTSAMAT